jgi:spermidine/putrescine-binding protein
LKPNIRKMWSTGGELTNLFQNHEVVAAMGWPLMTNQLRKINFPVGETIPKGKHHGLDRPPDDHRGQREQRTGLRSFWST